MSIGLKQDKQSGTPRAEHSSNYRLDRIEHPRYKGYYLILFFSNPLDMPRERSLVIGSAGDLSQVTEVYERDEYPAIHGASGAATL